MKYKVVKEKEDSSKNKLEALVENPKWTLNEIALSEEVLEQVREIIAYVHNKDKLLQEWKFERFLKTGSALSINFFGVPGTGKSITAEAIANELNTTIIKASYGELESALVGETSDNFLNLFKMAEETKSLVFLDEADSALSRRIASPSHAADHGVNSVRNTLFKILDEFNGVVVFATNFFDSYDKAFLRRILFHVEFIPPDYEMRISLWKFHLTDAVPMEISYERLSEITDELCGGDIKNLAVKFGLKLLTNKYQSINESLVISEVTKYRQIKHRKHPSQITISTPDEENNTHKIEES